MKNLSLLLTLVLLVIINNCTSYEEMTFSRTEGQPIVKSSKEVLSDDGAWCWFSDPRAIYYEGNHQRTYVGWISSQGDIQISYYDHTNNEVHIETLEANFQEDDHNNPSLFIDKEGRILVFYSEHATERPIILHKSKYPEDISQWEESVVLDLNNEIKYQKYSNTYTYTNPQYLTEEDKLFLFWRGSDFKPNYAVSDDMGESWSKGNIFILPDRKYPDRRPYLKVSSNGQNTIHFAFTQGHPRKEEDNSIYYMNYSQGNFYRADNSVINDTTRAVVPNDADLVYDASGGAKSWIWDVTSDKRGYPVLVYSKFPDDSTHIYSYAQWDGDKWNNYDLIDSGKWFPETPRGKNEPEPHYSGGIVLDHEDPSIVYLSREKGGTFEIERWKTTDNGRTWKQKVLTSNSDNDNVRPFAVRNATANNALQVLWMTNNKYLHYTEFSSQINMLIERR